MGDALQELGDKDRSVLIKNFVEAGRNEQQ